jgi:transcription elongation GreA/GreB family factor
MVESSFAKSLFIFQDQQKGIGIRSARLRRRLAKTKSINEIQVLGPVVPQNREVSCKRKEDNADCRYVKAHTADFEARIVQGFLPVCPPLAL